MTYAPLSSILAFNLSMVSDESTSREIVFPVGEDVRDLLRAPAALSISVR